MEVVTSHFSRGKTIGYDIRGQVTSTALFTGIKIQVIMKAGLGSPQQRFKVLLEVEDDLLSKLPFGTCSVGSFRGSFFGNPPIP